MKSLISFVIPCYRSSKTILSVVDEIFMTMASMKEKYRFEIILVNDGSPDDTEHVINEIASTREGVVAISLSKNFGQHAALMAGLKMSKGSYVVCLDDDGQTPAIEVGRLLEKLDAGYDVVYASYPEKKHNFLRNLGSSMNGRMLEIMLNKPKDLYVSSYFAAKRFLINEMIRYNNCYPYIMGLVLRSTNNICNVQVNHRTREAGNSGYNLKKLMSLWLNGFTSFSIKPLRMATYFGFISAIGGFIYLIFILVNYFDYHKAPLGWSSSVATNLILGGVILIVLGLIGEYVGRIFMCTNETPQFIIKNIVNNSKWTANEDENKDRN